MTTYLGIDYGTKHLGLAIADGPLARPLISLDGLTTGEVLTRLGKLISEHGVESVVIGLPEGKMDKEVQQFGDKLNATYGVVVNYHPETLSTQEALSALRASGAGKAKLKNDHVYAACLILEDYLESNA